MFQMMRPGVDYNLTLSRTENKMTVLVMPKVNELKDSAQHNLVPFTVTATADEIDRGFFSAVQQPVARAAVMLANMAEYEKHLDKAASNSKSAKEQKEKLSKEEKAKKDKHDGHLKKAEEQETAGNLDGALTQLQQARLHATEKEQKTVDEKIAALKAKMGKGSLFDVPAAEATSTSVPVQASEQLAAPAAMPQSEPAATAQTPAQASEQLAAPAAIPQPEPMQQAVATTQPAPTSGNGSNVDMFGAHSAAAATPTPSPAPAPAQTSPQTAPTPSVPAPQSEPVPPASQSETPEVGTPPQPVAPQTSAVIPSPETQQSATAASAPTLMFTLEQAPASAATAPPQQASAPQVTTQFVSEQSPTAPAPQAPPQYTEIPSRSMTPPPPAPGQPQHYPQGYPIYAQPPHGGGQGCNHSAFAPSSGYEHGYLPQGAYAHGYPQREAYTPGHPRNTSGNGRPTTDHAPVDGCYNERDYDGIADVHLTHVGQMMSNPQSQIL